MMAIANGGQEAAHGFRHLLGIAAHVEAHAIWQFNRGHQLVHIAVDVAGRASFDTGIDGDPAFQRLAFEHLRAGRRHELDHLTQRHHDRVAGFIELARRQRQFAQVRHLAPARFGQLHIDVVVLAIRRQPAPDLVARHEWAQRRADLLHGQPQVAGQFIVDLDDGGRVRAFLAVFQVGQAFHATHLVHQLVRDVIELGFVAAQDGDEDRLVTHRHGDAGNRGQAFADGFFHLLLRTAVGFLDVG